ncbi:MAG TPA: aminoacyl-tRNA hydrolase [Spirochaetota bacterium]|nr:aminoacyl-tRNA hydrolase [Spirochaetota bacterium]HOM38798.1 aminoacyl-tRNA hydrolase [Spirochaetota bacterium]HPQ49856.1 aminoacyl-tRNA hydrolase [Spirochaetota bacterium]
MKNNKEIYVVAGLGNPGIKYSNNRHNVGFRVVDLILKDMNLSLKDKNDYELAITNFNSKKLFLLKPMMYMNLSGIPILHIVSYHRISAENLIVVYDDVDIPLGKIRIRKDGGHGGHNGVRSIIENLNKSNFIRIRIGIGKPVNQRLENYVLSNFTPVEEPIIRESIETAKQAVYDIIEKGLEFSMNKYN